MFDIKKQSEKMVEKNIEIHHHHHHHYVCVFPVNLFFFSLGSNNLWNNFSNFFALFHSPHRPTHTHGKQSA